MTPIPGPAAYSDEWRSLRKFDRNRKGREVVFGATDSAACCGISPYRTPLDVFVEKMMGREVEENDAMRMGKRLEPIILDEYELRRRVKLTRGLPMYFHSEHHWMSATPDALGDINWAVDAKATTYRRLDKDGGDPLKFGAENTDQMPVDIVLQGQQQCAVLALDYVEFAALFDARTLRIYRVDRNDSLIESIVKAEGEMFDRLMANDPPEPNWEHENTRELIGILFGHKEEVVRELDEEDACRWAQVQRYKDQIKAMEEANTIELNRLLFKLEGASRGVFPSGTQQLKRIVVKESLVTEQDVLDLKERVGQTKRKGFEYLKQTKV